MNELIIRSAAVEDMPSLLVFEQGVIEAERPFDPTIKDNPVSYYNLEEMITANNVELLVAEINNRVIGSGYARIEESKPFHKNSHYAYLGFMYVLPEYRGKGVNGRILQQLKTWAIARGISEFRLQVYNYNMPAVAAYEKAGFSNHLIEMRLGLKEL